MEYTVKIISKKYVTHNVNSYRVERPVDYTYKPGQATELSLNKSGWQDEKRPFTFTSLQNDPFLEFTIKSYFDHDGVTNELSKLNAGDELIISDVWGAIEFKGPGCFIAGGAGVTPFIAILRYLHSANKINGNKLIFSNKTKSDIILEEEFKNLLGKNFINILSEEKTDEFSYGNISEDFLKANLTDFDKYFYVCGPPPMIDAIEKQLDNLNVKKDLIVKEEL